MKKTLADFEDMKAENARLKKDLNESHDKRKALQKEFDRALEDHKKEMEREYEERQNLIKEKNEVANQLRKAEQKITGLEKVIDGQKLDISERDDEIERLKNLLKILEDIKNQRDALQKQLKESQDAREQLSKEIADLVKQGE